MNRIPAELKHEIFKLTTPPTVNPFGYGEHCSDLRALSAISPEFHAVYKENERALLLTALKEYTPSSNLLVLSLLIAACPPAGSSDAKKIAYMQDYPVGKKLHPTVGQIKASFDIVRRLLKVGRAASSALNHIEDGEQVSMIARFIWMIDWHAACAIFILSHRLHCSSDCGGMGPMEYNGWYKERLKAVVGKQRDGNTVENWHILISYFCSMNIVRRNKETAIEADDWKEACKHLKWFMEEKLGTEY